MDKDEKKELSKTFSPGDVEKKLYHFWEKEGLFKPKPGKTGKTFCIIMPPPNVTGILHMGHALDAATQDILTRYKRMKGYETLWLPGMDHAGIATQSVVEKKIYEEEGKFRHDYKRDEFIKKTWEWKEHHGGKIQKQQRALGVSCDWDYSLFTMDSEANKAVNKAFVDMYNEGLIIQSDYIVNWDPELQTAISDAEVEYKELKGAYYHIKYQIKDGSNFLIVATTRPETLLGDTAVAVHPEDKRFKKYIGQKAIVPLCQREVPIIADAHVDTTKGTGCLKVTPGHDFNDFEIGKRHGLEIINILNKDGTLNEYGLEWQGLSALETRKSIVEKLVELDLLEKQEEVIHQVGHGERSHAVVEPMVSKQWFVKTKEMARLAIKVVEQEKVRFFPRNWENTYFSWLREPKDWCISRQLWWGHRIPIFNCKSCSHQWAQEEIPSQCPKCQSQNPIQDPDVLDTWFSSALWPLSTLGWPIESKMEEKGFSKFYPSSVLITGHDIIFFWVARMVMMGLKHTQEIPFHHVYIHAIVRDKYGRKMSKSLGNGIDPLQTCDQYGADSLRFTLAAGSGYNRTIDLDPARIEGYRNFINKLWNAFRFIYPFLSKASKDIVIDDLDHQDRWILSELNTVINKMNESFDEYRFDDSCAAIYQFTYSKFCSWYIEFSKPILYGDNLTQQKMRATVLKHCFKKMMALLHPIAPFISEEIWQYIKDDHNEALITTEYPKYEKSQIFEQDQLEMNQFIEVSTKIREMRQNIGLSPKKEIKIEIFTDQQDFCRYIEKNVRFLSGITKSSEIKISQKSSRKPKQSIMAATSFCEIFIPLDRVINLKEEIIRLKKEISKTETDFKKFEKKLSNQNFIEKAKEEVVFSTKEKAAKFLARLESLKKNLNNLK
ncbi:MAG: valine--tRNA ligase [Bacteriovoracales bacterium]|nr:valine--tRNA ligase [Bacteriovoracales bacterium]